MRIDSDDPAVTDALAALRRTVLDDGGAFSPQLRIVARGGELTVEADPDADTEGRLMQVPVSCLPPSEAFEVTVVDGEFAVVRETETVPEPARTSFYRMLDVYNACGKAAAWRKASPWFALRADPAVLDALLDLRPDVPKVAKHRKLAEAGDDGELLVASFLGARVFNLRPRAATQADAEQEPEISDRADGRHVLMPVIDFLNHDFRARSYQITVDDDDVRRLWTYGDRPVAGSRECFVRYSPMDMLDAYLNYGFVDESVAMFRSVPVELALPDGTRIEVGARGGQAFQGKLPEFLEDARFFVPPILDSRGAGHLSVARLVLPGPEAPRALRRVLGFLIATIRPNQGQAARRDAVLAAEAQVLRANRARFDDLVTRVAEARAQPPRHPPPGRAEALAAVDRLADRAKAYVDAYAHRMGLT